MSGKASISSEDSGDSRLRRELKALRKLKAPWYMEAQLFKRLRFQDRPRWAGIPIRPLPAYMLSGAALVVLLIVGYNTLTRVGPSTEHLHGVPEGIRQSVEPPQRGPASSGTSTPRKEVMVPEPGQRGPSPPGEAALQAKIADHPKAATSMKKKDSTTTIRDSIRTGSVKADGQDSVDVIESDTTVVE